MARTCKQQHQQQQQQQHNCQPGPWAQPQAAQKNHHAGSQNSGPLVVFADDGFVSHTHTHHKSKCGRALMPPPRPRPGGHLLFPGHRRVEHTAVAVDWFAHLLHPTAKSLRASQQGQHHLAAGSNICTATAAGAAAAAAAASTGHSPATHQPLPVQLRGHICKRKLSCLSQIKWRHVTILQLRIMPLLRCWFGVINKSMLHPQQLDSRRKLCQPFTKDHLVVCCCCTYLLLVSAVCP
jgi:hypothetical protein